MECFDDVDVVLCGLSAADHKVVGLYIAVDNAVFVALLDAVQLQAVILMC